MILLILIAYCVGSVVALGQITGGDPMGIANLILASILLVTVLPNDSDYNETPED